MARASVTVTNWHADCSREPVAEASTAKESGPGRRADDADGVVIRMRLRLLLPRPPLQQLKPSATGGLLRGTPTPISDPDTDHQWSRHQLKNPTN